MTVLWFTGLSGSGKTTLSEGLQQRLKATNINTETNIAVLDGDVIRTGLCRDLGFSEADRYENIRRISEVAALMSAHGMLVITAFISPYKEHRTLAHSIIGESFHNVYIKADIQTCKNRDPKGLYAKALNGDIPQFTGISDRFDIPQTPDLIIDTARNTIETCIDQLEAFTNQHHRASARTEYA